MRSLKEKLLKVFPESRVFDDPLAKSSVAVDASFYRIEPQCVVDVLSDEEIASLMKICADESTSLTFRAAGTSLSGQAQGSGVLARITRGFKKIEVLDQGNKIRLGAGVIGARANQALEIFEKKIGPDPASIHSCMVGGIVANNASGMCCGVDQNTYRTFSEMKFILPPDAKNKAAIFVDTASKESRERFQNLRKDVYSGLAQIRNEILQDQELKNRITKKYRIKNTMGYSLNSFLDYEDPIDVLSHLMVGSEGTLGFVSEITYQTIPDLKLRACAFVVFSSLSEACQRIQSLKALSLTAAEIMDCRALKSVADHPEVPIFLKSLPVGSAALLIETRAQDRESLERQVQTIEAHLNSFLDRSRFEFSHDPLVFEKWWNIRRGLFPSVAKGRKPGTTVIIEDVAVPLPSLADAAIGLENLLTRHGYFEAVVFGHALDGNLHFVFTQDFSKPQEFERYEALMRELTEWVTEKWDGSLKAEHGTGRNMAPFLEKEWGEKATQLMWRIKNLIDPLSILNPDVILSNNSRVHLESIKDLPAVHPAIDDCMECGFCENHCPSVDLTLSPRQRIAAFRESKRSHDSVPILEKFNYEIDQTCAADGLCATACPVGIDTGSWIKNFRAEKKEGSNWKITLSILIARTFSFWIKLVSIVFLIRGNFRSNPQLKVLSRASHSMAPHPVIFVPSCISRSMTRALPDSMINVLTRAGYDVLIPSHLSNQCCGLPFESKGYREAAELKVKSLDDELWKLSREGKIPIVCDTSPCSLQMQKKLNHQLQVFDSVSFIHRFLLSGKSPKSVTFKKSLGSVAIHPTCSTQKMSESRALFDIASACAEKVIVPNDVECCGFAGDKGWSHPELVASALMHLPAQVKNHCQRGLSTSPTCEIGLSRMAGIPYESIIYTVERSMGAKNLTDSD